MTAISTREKEHDANSAEAEPGCFSRGRCFQLSFPGLAVVGMAVAAALAWAQAQGNVSYFLLRSKGRQRKVGGKFNSEFASASRPPRLEEPLTGLEFGQDEVCRVSDAMSGEMSRIRADS